VAGLSLWPPVTRRSFCFLQMREGCTEVKASKLGVKKFQTCKSAGPHVIMKVNSITEDPFPHHSAPELSPEALSYMD